MNIRHLVATIFLFSCVTLPAVECRGFLKFLPFFRVLSAVKSKDASVSKKYELDKLWVKSRIVNRSKELQGHTRDKQGSLDAYRKFNDSRMNKE